ncbi:MAG TPA: MFS transporter [Thermoleophilaceae bacterium]|nr:MFS transporter [Thermoleophilaceae bacterium]
MASKWWTLLVVCLAIFMLLLDITVVNVALPNIQKDLGASFEDLQWVVDAYALALAALLLASGSIADLLGRRRVFVAGLLLFVMASLLCGLSSSPTMLNVSRGLQGIGGAMMFATSLALIAQEFPPNERGTAFGIWGATTGFAVAVGPLVGGALTEAFGWEWIFLVNVPIGLLTAAITVARVPESERDPTARIDWAGVLTFSAGLFCLVLALIRGNDEGWTSGQILGLLAAAVILIAVFVAIELRREQPMLDLRLFRKPAFTGAQIVAFTLHASMFSMFLYLTLYMQNVLGYSPLETGVRFLPISLLSFLAAPIAGKLAERLPVRAFLGAGLVCVGVGLLLMSGIEPSDDWTTLLAGFIVAGVGIGFINPPLATAAIGVVEPRRAGAASGINSTFRQVGTAVGIAGLGALLQSKVSDKLDAALANAPLPRGAPSHIAEAVSSGGASAAARGVPAPARGLVANTARRAFIEGLNEILVVAAVLAFVGAALALLLVRRRDFVTAPAGPPTPAAEPAA